MHVDNARDAADLLAPLLRDVERERLAVLHLGPDRAMLTVKVVEGEVDHVALPVRAIMADSLLLGSAGLILAHNHPSGDPEPSADDLAATRRLAVAADALDIRLWDHLIFARGGIRSLRGLGLL